MQIIHYAAKELALHGINLMYTYMPALYRPGYELPASLEGGAVGGFIVLNIYDQELLRLLSKSPLPKVFLDTIPAMPERALGGDLLIIEGRTRVCDITARLLDRGYRRLGFVGDVNYAQTNMDRYRGFLDAHAAHGVTPDPALSMTALSACAAIMRKSAAFSPPCPPCLMRLSAPAILSPTISSATCPKPACPPANAPF